MSWREKVTHWAEQLKRIGDDGLVQPSNIYEKDNYQAFHSLAVAMAKSAADETITFEPLEATLSGKLSPAAVADAAVVDEHGRLLMIRRADNNMWAMPGGALEVGETFAEGAAREAYEETGVRCEPVTLIGVWDSRLYEGVTSRFHMYQMTVLCQPLAGAKIDPQPSHAVEIKDVRWFTEDKLPPLDEIDAGHRPRLPHVFRVWRGDKRPFFNPLMSSQA